MKKAPDIQVQLVHIDGPLKGEIQEFYQDVIVVGRHPDCEVVFPRDDTGISRKHAEFKREGNRYKILDNSTNGTLLNGKPVKEEFLKNGDVLIFGEDGPKVSFLSTMTESKPIPAGLSELETSAKVEPNLVKPVVPLPKVAELKQDFFKEKADLPEQVTPPVENEKKAIQQVQKSLVIQYGATLKAFKKLPVTVGSGLDCDFVINDRGLLEHHLQIFFSQEKYWIKDLTGRNIVTVNGQPINDEAELRPDACLALTSGGPQFQFLGDGRLAEIDEQENESHKAAVNSERGRGKDLAQVMSTGEKKSKWIFILPVFIIILLVSGYFLMQMPGKEVRGLSEFFNDLQQKISSFLENK